MRDLIILRIGPTERPIQLHNGSLYFSIKTDLYRILRVTRGTLFGPIKNKPRDAYAHRFDFDPPEFLSVTNDHVDYLDYGPLSNCTKFLNRFGFSSNNQRLIQTQIRRVNDHVIDELVELRF